MKTRRPLVLPVVLALLAGITGSVALLRMTGTPDGRAGRVRSDAGVLETTRSATRGHWPESARAGGLPRAGHATATARDAVRDPRDAASLEIPIGGTVDGLPESVRLEGLARITTSVVRDPDFGQPPAVMLSIDFSHVSGVGLSTGASYVTSEEMNLTRPLVASDVVELAFAVFPNHPDGALSARPAVASFTLDFDPRTGRFSGRTASTLATPVDSQ